jgi:hypothetical protein
MATVSKFAFHFAAKFIHNKMFRLTHVLYEHPDETAPECYGICTMPVLFALCETWSLISFVQKARDFHMPTTDP